MRLIRREEGRGMGQGRQADDEAVFGTVNEMIAVESTNYEDRRSRV